MIAYRVKIIGSNDHYLITNQQRPEVERAMDQGGNSIVRIGGNVIRANSIRSLTEILVDLDSCPAYFQKQVQAERGATKTNIGQNYRRLPTRWAILGRNKIFSMNVAMDEIESISRAFLETRAEGEPLAHFLVAKCHYHIGADSEPQLHTKLEEIPEALECIPNKYFLKQMRIVQIYKYGVAQLHK